MMVQEICITLPVLCALAAANIVAGTVNSITGETKNAFDTKRLIQGLARAIALIAGFFALAYAFDTMNLSPDLEYAPTIIINIGITTYSIKLAINLIKLAGLEKYIQIINPSDKKQ